MKLIDTHIHASNLTPMQLENLIQNDKICKFICVSSTESDWSRVVELSIKYPEKIIPAFGIHPWYSLEAKPGWEKRLEDLLIKYPSSLVGEIGLDRLNNTASEPQNSVFGAQLMLAKKHNRTALIHAVKSQDWLEAHWQHMPDKFVIHSFAGKNEFMNKILSRGGYISFSPSILRHNKDNIIRLVPSNRLLLESDAPYQGDACSVLSLCEELSNLRGEDISQITYNNAMEIIKIG